MYVSTGNRFGKTELAGVILMIVSAFIVPERIPNPADFPVLNASITQDQANIAWRFCERLAESRRFEHWVDDVVTSPFPTIRLAHGGEIWARSTQHDCKYVEGHKFRLINFDEIALGTKESLDVLRMRVADIDGTVMGTGTPRGKNWYYRDAWRKAENEIAAARAEERRARAFLMTGASYDNPHISHSYLREMESTMSERQVAQKIRGEFTDDAAKPFSSDAVDGCLNPDLNFDYDAVCAYVRGAPMRARQRKRAEFLTSTGYWVCAWDLAKAVDWTVCCALRMDTKPWQLLYFDRYQRRPWPNVESDIKHVADALGSRAVYYDATGMDQTGDHLDIEPWRIHKFMFTAARKTDMINNAVRAMEHQEVEIPYIEPLIEELNDYEWQDKALVQDCVMSFGMSLWGAMENAARVGPQPEAEVGDSLRAAGDWT